MSDGPWAGWTAPTGIGMGYGDPGAAFGVIREGRSDAEHHRGPESAQVRALGSVSGQLQLSRSAPSGSRAALGSVPQGQLPAGSTRLS